MKRINWYVILLIINCSFCWGANGVEGADSSIATYPLQVGDLWQYYTYDYLNGRYTMIYGWTDKVIGDTIMSNKNKYAMIATDKALGSTTFWRQESSKVYLYKRGIDSLVYDFSKHKNEIYVVKPVSNNDTLFQIVKDQGYGTYFGLDRQYWTFEIYFAKVTYYEEKDIVDGVGMTYVISEGGDEWFLTGAIIDGKNYGTITAIKSDDHFVGPKGFELYTNYPNPFNGTTNISYYVNTPQYVDISIFDLLGKKVAHLLSDKMLQGRHHLTWHGTDDQGRILPSGIYILHLQCATGSKQMKMLMLK